MKSPLVDRQIENSNKFKNALILCGLAIDKNWFFKIWDRSIEIVLTENGTFERVFGSKVNLYVEIDLFTKQKGVKLSTGSMGSFDMSCKASVAKCLLMSELVKNFKNVEALAKQFCEKEEKINEDRYNEVNKIKK